MNYFQQPSYNTYDSSVLYPTLHCIIESTTNQGGLYLGSYDAALNTSYLQSQNIRSVLTIGFDMDVNLPSDFTYLGIFALDSPKQDLTQAFETSFNFIEQNRKYTNVLVHCMAGVSRSTSLVLYYLMKKYGMSLDDAFNHTKSIRNVINPNPGFMNQLRNIEKTLFNNQLGYSDRYSNNYERSDIHSNFMNNTNFNGYHNKRRESFSNPGDLSLSMANRIQLSRFKRNRGMA